MACVNEWKEKARKTKNKMARHSNNHKSSNYQCHEMGRQRANNMDKFYRRCRQGSDMTQRHKVSCFVHASDRHLETF